MEDVSELFLPCLLPLYDNLINSLFFFNNILSKFNNVNTFLIKKVFFFDRYPAECWLLSIFTL